jgi:hypothetical protein
MNKPSQKTLESAFPGKGRVLRQLLTSDSAVRQHPAAIRREREAYHPHALHTLRLEALDAELEGYGVEYVERGEDASSPAFEYVNMGDTYATTIVRLQGGRYRVCCWGDIVERGRYS